MKNPATTYSLLLTVVFQSIMIFFMASKIDNGYHEKRQLKSEIDSLSLTIEARSHITKRFPISTPIHDFMITSEFGERVDPFIDSLVKNHKGIDILNVNENDTVYATACGRVVESRLSVDYGNLIVLRHQSGFSTLYAHMDTNFVCKGDSVYYDSPIGIVGTTGKSTAPHLHYEILFNDENQNPNNIIQFNLKK